MEKGFLSDLSRPGAQFEVRVTPGASRDRITVADGVLRIHVTAAPEAGKANAAVQKVLARALGVPKSRLRLIRGQTARDKVFVLD